MCGIAGKISWHSPPSVEVVKKMTDALAHRGPDDHDVIGLGNAVLGHRRLSIIDLSERSRQPMRSSDGRFFIVYNGEIYNFLEIRKELAAEGVVFNTTSDTEVFLYAYIRYGEECLKKFNGMFAVAIWDSVNMELFLARDRFGKKPLYYYRHADNGISFASELRAFKVDPDIKLEYSLEAMNCYLALGYILAPMSCYKDVYKLKQASWMKISDEGRKVETGIYWDFLECFHRRNDRREGDISADILTLLEESVKRRLVSDVPVGAFLSGGIDSSSIVALMKSINSGKLHTFSIGFDETGYSELEDARRTAEFFDTVHHQEICRAKHGTELLESAISAYDEPFADNSLVPTYEVSKIASKTVKVVLSGDGADELFAGYVTYKADKYYRFAKFLPPPLKRILASEAWTSGRKKISLNYKRKQFFYGAMKSPQEAHYSWRLYFRPEQRVKILGEKHRDLVFDTDPFKIFKKFYEKTVGLDYLSANLYVDSMTWLTDDILVKVDRASMAHGLEVRAPFLDVKLAEYAASIPSSMKLKGLTTKYILRKAVKDILPDFVLRKPKSGFNAPSGSWIGTGGMDEFCAFNRYVLDKTVRTW
jgi:asparagine synthase (glutamine-hydrolysing)